MADSLLKRSIKLCVAVHFVAWLAAAAAWGVKWWREGPAPSGPLYYSAHKFIERLDVLVYGVVHHLTINVSQIVSTRYSADVGASLMSVFAVLILIAGTLQWFLLGKLVVWIATHQGRGLALTVLGVYAIWTIRAVFLWTMS